MRRALKIFAIVVLVALAGLSLAGAAYTPSTDIPAGLAGKHVSVHGIALRVWQQGSGPDVLLIHGSPGSVEDWAPIVQALSGEARLTAYDRPGNGYSGVTGDYSLVHNADVALELIDALQLHDVTVVGHSYGGATALQLAIRAPANVKSYVILDSSGYVPGRPPTPLFRLLMVPGLGTGVARAFGGKLAAPRISAGIMEQFNGRTPPSGFIATRIAIWSNPKVTRTIAAETIGAAANLAAQSPSYRSIHAPVRVVGQSQRPERRASAERLHRDVPGSTLRLLDGTGHYVQIEKPREVADEIRAAIHMR